MEFESRILSDSLQFEADKLMMQRTHEAEAYRANRTRNILGGLGILVLLLSTGLYSRLRYVRKSKARLQVEKDRAERSERYKEQFLANMSHEIRTPMHAISGMTNILIRNKHDQGQDKFLNAIQESSANLLVILNDILDLSKIESGKISVESIPVDLRKVLKTVVDVLRVKAEEKAVTIAATVDPAIPDWINGDPTRLNQILLNLIGNAIKFTEKGNIDITVAPVDGKLQFTVADTGIGIPADKLGQVFETFEQVNDSTTRKYGGTGLGLSITKKLVEIQQGTIWVESTENKGSKFIFELPLVPSEAKPEGKNGLTDADLKRMGKSMAGMTVLLAEDNEFNQMVCSDDLNYYIDNVTIELANNGQEAVDKFQSGKFDVVLMDIQMPEMNGYEATRKIRRLEEGNNEKATPIIAMTASLLKSEIDQCYEAGMNSYIPKPYQIEEFVGRLYEEAGILKG